MLTRNILCAPLRYRQLEAHSPKDWTPEPTQRLRDLVDELGESRWIVENFKFRLRMHYVRVEKNKKERN